MNRKFEERKPTKVYVKSKENQTIIKALNMYGRVPEMWELLQEIDKYKEILDKIKEKLQNELDNYNITMGRAEKIELLELLEEIE